MDDGWERRMAARAADRSHGRHWPRSRRGLLERLAADLWALAERERSRACRSCYQPVWWQPPGQPGRWQWVHRGALRACPHWGAGCRHVDEIWLAG